MQALLTEYMPILIFMGLAAIVTLALLVVPLLVAPSNPDTEKLSPYECGFEAFDDARMKFDVKFYLVAILFIIFDLEIAFLFPWAVAFGDIGLFGFWSMMFFLAVLTIGFAYEWKKGALEWDQVADLENYENKGPSETVSEELEIVTDNADFSKDPYYAEVSDALTDKGFVVTSVEDLVNWARTGSLHWMTFGLKGMSITTLFVTHSQCNQYCSSRYEKSSKWSFFAFCTLKVLLECTDNIAVNRVGLHRCRQCWANKLGLGEYLLPH